LQTSTIAAGDQQNNSFSAFLTDGGPGTNTIDLRGLGAQKTLVLVNGRRFAPAGTSGTVNSVDLNTIPSAIIERIEILKDGASSVYGADAVSGVVNIITRTDLDGGVYGFGGTITELGGGESFDVNLGWGQVFERGRFDIAMTYFNREELVATDRDWSECEYSVRISEVTGARTDIDPATGQPFCFDLTSRPISGAVFTPFGPYGWIRFDPNRTGANRDLSLAGLERFTNDTLPVTRNTPASRDPAFPNILPGDLRSNDIAQVITPVETFSLTSFGEYQLAAGTELFYEAYFSRREQSVTSGWGQFFYTGDNGEPGSFGMPYTNPLNPLGIEGALGGFGGFDVVPLAPTYGLDPYTDVSVDLFNLTAGARGEVFNQRFDYEIYGQFGRSEGETEFEAYLQTQTERALDAIRVGPNIVCRSAFLGIDPACVPLDVFTARFMLDGQLTPQERAYLVSREGTSTTYEQYALTGYLTGDLIDLPAGALKGVFGLEYRNARINDLPSANVANNNLLNLTTAGQTKGRDEVQEAFVEFEAPLLSNSPLARSLTANVSARYTDYDSYGDDTTYRVGLDWQITDFLKVRSTFGTSFRPPALYEQFLADLEGFSSLLNDPCINYGTRDPLSAVYLNCQAEGLPLNFGDTGGPDFATITGGGDELIAETSEAFTFGLVWQPESVDINVAVDYYKIEVNDEIIRPSSGTVLGQCYSEVGFGNAFCSRIGPRDINGFLTEVDTSYLNISSQLREGIDVNVVYNHELEWGTFEIDAELGYLINANAELFGATSNFDGEWGFPQWQGQVDFRVDWQDWTGFWAVDWIGKSEQVGTSALATTRRYLRVEDYFNHSASVRYNATDWDLTVGVRNIFDVEPPILSDGASGPSASFVYNTLPGAGYDLLGRSLFVSISGRF
jgi:iron complex outermembrane receptor protein